MEFIVQGLKEINLGTNFNVSINHNNQSLIWSLSSLGRSVIKTEKLFDELNELLKTYTSNEQDKMFELLASIKNDFEKSEFDLVSASDSLFKAIRNKVTALLAYFDFERVKRFVIYNNKIIIPSNFLDLFQHDITKNITRDKTYTRDDYIELVAMVLILKLLLPIFAHYINIIKGEVGNEYKENYVLGIMNASQFNNHRTIEKLTQYITGTLNLKDFDSKEIIIKGISEEEFVDILLSKTIIRKLIVSDLKEADINHNLITYTYKFMNQIKKENEKGPNNTVTIKDVMKNSEMESSLSTLEQFKLKQDVAIGDIVALEHYLKNNENLITKFYSNLDSELIKEFSHNSEILTKAILYSPQVTMLRLLFKNIISPNAILYLPKDKIINFIVIGSTILWQEELKFLSLMLSAVNDPSLIGIHNVTNNEHKIVTISSFASRGRLSLELIEELDRQFPYHYAKRDKNIAKNKTTNVAIDAIDRLIVSFNDHVWYSTANIYRVREAMNDNSTNDNMLYIPHNIKNEVAKFFLLCQKLKGDVYGQ